MAASTASPATPMAATSSSSSIASLAAIGARSRRAGAHGRGNRFTSLPSPRGLAPRRARSSSRTPPRSQSSLPNSLRLRGSTSPSSPRRTVLRPRLQRPLPRWQDPARQWLAERPAQDARRHRAAVPPRLFDGVMSWPNLGIRLDVEPAGDAPNIVTDVDIRTDDPDRDRCMHGGRSAPHGRPSARRRHRSRRAAFLRPTARASLARIFGANPDGSLLKNVHKLDWPGRDEGVALRQQDAVDHRVVWAKTQRRLRS